MACAEQDLGHQLRWVTAGIHVREEVFPDLTAREHQILDPLAAGLNDAAIAQRVGAAASDEAEPLEELRSTRDGGKNRGMLIYSTGVSVDGFTTHRQGDIRWTAPCDELFGFHLERVRELGASLCGRRLYQTMLVWETDPSLRDGELGAAFADAWSALPKIVFSRTLERVEGNARLAQSSVAVEAAATLDATDKDVEIGGATLAGAAIELGLVDELRLFRYPVIVGGGTPALPPLAARAGLDLVEARTFCGRVVYERYRRAAAE